jgi:serine protease SohB
MDFLSDYGVFAAKFLTIIIATTAALAFLVTLSSRNRQTGADSLSIRKLSGTFEKMAERLRQETLPEAERKKARKAAKKAAKAREKEARPRVFVLRFDGDLRASGVNRLREEVTAVVQVADENDEVVVLVESGGGTVHGYGLAASQLKRFRDRQIPLTVCVDKVAASGGYMMACVGSRILAAPFAIIGSIGVVMQLPNFNRFLKANNIDFEMVTAGEHKRTLTFFGENTDEGREKVREELEQAHELFKRFITEYRPEVDIEHVATGEHWFGTQALDLKLVDEIRTSDDYLVTRAADCDVFEISYRAKPTLLERLTNQGTEALARLFG